ncbi:PQQ-dependent catabolism-associated CXXCW motif protein [Billgrantia azerbaijanica]|nr:PQQ-dependent catabolism-associated CXXCW motif protein [Halomonas azerbaijanica]
MVPRIILSILISLPCALFTLAVTAFAADGTLFSEAGYRIDRYRSPTPSHLEGARVFDTDTLAAALEGDAAPLVIDVYNLSWQAGRFLATEPHASLPGAHWLPNTGLGKLAPAWEEYLLHHLARLTDGDRTVPLAFLCRSDCWLSWNAARRALANGYTGVGWYPEGVDGWEASGRALEVVNPALPTPALRNLGSGHDG